MLDERKHMEDLVNTRIGFLLVFISISVGPLIAKDVDPVMRSLALSFTALIAFMLAQSIARAHDKLEFIFRFLNEDGDSAFSRIDMAMASGGSRRKWVGYYVPLICWTSLAVAAIVSWCQVAFPLLCR